MNAIRIVKDDFNFEHNMKLICWPEVAQWTKRMDMRKVLTR